MVTTDEKNVITITYEGGNLKYDSCNVQLDWEDEIVWKCMPRNPFAIHIGWDSPLEKGRYRSVDGEPIRALVPKGALPGRFKYSVAVFDEETNEIWTDDPEFVVRRRR